MIARSMTKKVLGYIPRDDRAVLESRHLGLKMAFEVPDQTGAGDLVSESCDLGEIEKTASSAVPLNLDLSKPVFPPRNARIGVARDEAFCFYYQDNLDLLSSPELKSSFSALFATAFPMWTPVPRRRIP